MVEDLQKSARNDFLRVGCFCFISKGFGKGKESKSITISLNLIGRVFLNDLRLYPYLEINGFPAKARLIFLVKRMLEYLDGLAKTRAAHVYNGP